MVDAAPAVPAARAGRNRRAAFFLGFALGLGLYLLVITTLVYLKARDTSKEPWETLTLGAAAAVVCIAPVQLLVSLVLMSNPRIRWLSVGLFAAGVVGLLLLIVLTGWSSMQAELYARRNHLP